MTKRPKPRTRVSGTPDTKRVHTTDALGGGRPSAPGLGAAPAQPSVGLKEVVEALNRLIEVNNRLVDAHNGLVAEVDRGATQAMACAAWTTNPLHRLPGSAHRPHTQQEGLHRYSDE